MDIVKIIRGLVRPVISLLIAILFCYCVITNILEKQAVTTIIKTVFMFWFVDRIHQKDKERTETTNQGIMERITAFMPQLIDALKQPTPFLPPKATEETKKKAKGG